MSVESFINRVILRDRAVYWGVPTSLGDGTASFMEPIEIPCVWKEDIRRVKDYFEKETVSRAHVYVNIDIAEKAMLFHGKLSDLTAEQRANPTSIPEAYEVRRFMKTPSLYLKNKFDRKAFI